MENGSKMAMIEESIQNALAARKAEREAKICPTCTGKVSFKEEGL